MLTKIIIISTSLSLLLLIILINVTTPVSAGPFGILAIFISSYIFLTGVIAFLIHFITKLLVYLLKNFRLRKPIKVATLKRSYYYSTIIAAAPIMLIAIQSVGSLGVYEFLLVFIFIVVGCLYVSKKVN